MDHYKLVFSIQGKSMEISSHEKDWVEKKEKEYKELITEILSSKVDFTQNSNIEEHTEIQNEKYVIPSTITINEFYRKYIHGGKVKTLPDIATYFIYYLTKIEKNNEYGPSDIKNLFKAVGYPKAEKINISDVLARAKKKAFLNNFDNQWTLTITGEDFVLNTISDSNVE